MMKYFYIRQHELYTDNPRIINWYGVINPLHMNREQAKRIPRRVLLPVAGNAHMVFPGILTMPFFLVNGMVRDVIRMYDDIVPFKQIVLLDPVNGQAELYFLPILEKLECLEPESKKMLLQRNLAAVKIDGTKILNKPIFCIKEQVTYIVVRLDLVESMLKRDSRGITLEPVIIV